MCSRTFLAVLRHYALEAKSRCAARAVYYRSKVDRLQFVLSRESHLFCNAHMIKISGRLVEVATMAFNNLSYSLCMLFLEIPSLSVNLNVLTFS